MFSLSKSWSDELTLNCHYIPDEDFDSLVEKYELQPRTVYKADHFSYRVAHLRIGNIELIFHT